MARTVAGIGMKMKTKFCCTTSDQPIYGVIILEDGDDVVIRQPSEDELEAGLVRWGWDGRTQRGMTREWSKKWFAPHDDFWAEGQSLRVFPRRAVAMNPFEWCEMRRSSVMQVWIETRNHAILTALSREGQAMQAKNAALIAKAAKMNADASPRDAR